MTTDTSAEALERKRFEEWYVAHAHDYTRDPIGSRDCALQWDAWKAALAAEKRRAREGVTPIKHSEQQPDGSFGYFVVLDAKNAPWQAGESKCIKCASEADADKCIQALEAVLQDGRDAKLYQELLMAVEKKFPGESRHETALRYICQAEAQSCEPKCDAATKDTDHD